MQKYAAIQAPGSRIPRGCQHLDLNGRDLVVRLIRTSAVVERRDNIPGEGAKETRQTGGWVGRRILRLPHDLEMARHLRLQEVMMMTACMSRAYSRLFFGYHTPANSHKSTTVEYRDWRATLGTRGLFQQLGLTAA